MDDHAKTIEIPAHEWKSRMLETGYRLRAARRDLGMTQQELAELVGLANYRPISRFERGACLPTTGVLIRLARALGRQVSDLLRPLDLLAAEHLAEALAQRRPPRPVDNSAERR